MVLINCSVPNPRANMRLFPPACPSCGEPGKGSCSGVGAHPPSPSSQGLWVPLHPLLWGVWALCSVSQSSGEGCGGAQGHGHPCQHPRRVSCPTVSLVTAVCSWPCRCTSTFLVLLCSPCCDCLCPGTSERGSRNHVRCERFHHIHTHHWWGLSQGTSGSTG